MLKILTFLFFSFTISLSAEEKVLYCSETKKVGLDGEFDYKSERFYNEKRSSVKIDFENQTFFSEEFGFTDAICYFRGNIIPRYMSCMDLGYLFTINYENYKFTLSSGFGYVLGDSDDITIAYGDCEKF